MSLAFKYIYGPVPSWRLGSSLGIDLLSQEEKICNFDCVYCQLGPTKEHASERKIYVPIEKVIEELSRIPRTGIDYITFSGRGEPTLAANLGEAIKAVKLIRKEPVAVITNGSLMASDEVREELTSADFVIAKLDGCSPEFLREINRPARGIEFKGVVEGIKAFRKEYQGKLALQIMFLSENKDDVDKYTHLANYIRPDEIQLNTPLRPCNVNPLSRDEIAGIRSDFIFACKEIKIASVYGESAPEHVVSISDEDTLKRRGKTK